MYKIDRYFGVSQAGSSIKTEIMSGIVTFVTMAYILALNPQAMVGFAPSQRIPALLLATALGATIGTAITALYAKLPFAQAPGMGLNALFGSVLVGGTSGLVFDNLLAIVFLSGLVFLLLSIIPTGQAVDGKKIAIREKLFDSIPQGLKIAIPAGIGLFIAFVGFANSNVIDLSGFYPSFVDLSHYNAQVAGALTCLFGFLVIVILSHYKVKGSILIGIVAGTVFAGIISIPLGHNGLLDYDMLAGKSGVSWAFWDNFADFFSFDTDKGAFGMFVGGFKFPKGATFEIIGLLLAFSMVNIFDTMGSLIGLSQMTAANSKGALTDESGKPLRFNRALLSDASSTLVGAVLGTSNVTHYVESSAGVASGGRTGLTALTVAVLFLLSVFVLPLFAFIPGAAASSALIYVGVLMMSHVVDIDFKDFRIAVPAFITIICMPLTYSIADGMGLGIISYCLIAIVCWTVEKSKSKQSKVQQADDGITDSTVPQEDATKTKFPSITAIIIAVLFVVFFVIGSGH